MRWTALKYLLLMTLPWGAYIAFWSHGWMTYITLVFTFLLIPLIELFIRPDEKNLDPIQEELIKEDRLYDLLLYLFVPVQFFLVYSFLSAIEGGNWSIFELIGKITAMGVMCGVTGINLGHELGHRSKGYEKFMSKALLLSSLYMHFYIEHNRGHHKNVSTHEDPASARYNEGLYSFWIRSMSTGYVSAWKLEKNRLNKLYKSALSIKNEMIQFTIVQVLFVLAIFLFSGLFPTLAFLMSAAIGILLLETVNYIEHYGLQRSKNAEGRYEIAKPIHSWNSDHIVGRLFLFELSRHSDHHFKTSRKYQILRHFNESPQMPTGYPGMMVLSMIPPLWFKIMNRRINDLKMG